MPNKLIVRLEAQHLQTPSWVVINTANEVTQLVLNGDPALLSDLAKDKDITVIVPGEDVFLTTITLPKMSRSKLLQAIPFALEDQIIEDVEAMHFALGEVKPGEPLSVVVVSNSKMQAWLDLLQAWRLAPEAILPSMLTIPVLPAAWQVAIDASVMVRMSTQAGFVCDADNISEMLLLAMSSATIPPEQINVTTIHHHSVRWSVPATINQALITREELLKLQAVTALQETPINLMQGDFAGKKSRRLPKLTRVLSIGLYLLIAWVVGLFLYPVVSFSILSERDIEIKQQMQAIYKQHFPTATSMIAPKDRMQQKLNSLTDSIGDNRMLLLMATIGKGLAQSSGVQIKRLNYQANMMTLEIAATSSEVFAHFTDALTQQGLRVKQENAALSGSRVNATLQIE